MTPTLTTPWPVTRVTVTVWVSPHATGPSPLVGWLIVHVAEHEGESRALGWLVSPN